MAAAIANNALKMKFKGPLVLQTLYAPVQRNARAKKWEGGGGGGGRGGRRGGRLSTPHFQASIWNVNKENI